MESIETNLSIIHGAGWEVEEIEMEPSMEGPVAIMTEDGQFSCKVKQVPAPSAYTVLHAYGVNKEGEEVHLSNAFDRYSANSEKFRQACYQGVKLGIQELFA